MGFFFFWWGEISSISKSSTDRLVLNAHRPKVWGLDQDQESAEPDRNGKFCGRTGTTIAREGRARNAEHERTHAAETHESERRHGERRDHAGGLGGW